MIPLIDGDILPWEIGCAVEYGEREIPDFSFVKDCIDGRIDGICRSVGATAPPVIFLSGPDNFRNEIAKRKGYKENRKGKEKPFHFYNIRAYLIHSYGAIVSDGVEADDLMATAQTDSTIICSRDKDLRQVPGYHFSWECGMQGEIGPFLVDELGEFWTKKLPKELKGTGLRFFFAQCLMGDTVDNIPGLPKCGPVKTYKTLDPCKTEEELEKAVFSLYEEVYGENAKKELTEQAQLVWMVREMKDGKPVMWEPKYV